jgi:UDP-glucose 4-epimerase
MTGNLLITGGFGYLGGRIARGLAGPPAFRVRVTTRKGECPPVPWLPPKSCVRMDLADDRSMAAACEGVDTVIHLAALNENESAADPLKSLLVNGAGTLRLLEAAAGAGVSRFLYFSTAHVYGAPLAGRITEATLPAPVHPYAITHRVAEDFVLAAGRRGSLDGMVVRLSNGIGAPALPTADRWTLVGNDLCRQAVVDRALRLKTPGLQERDFIPISDVVRGTAHLLSLDREAAGDGLFNLGGECSMTILALARLVRERARAVLGYTPPLHAPPAGGESPGEALVYSIDRLKATGFRLEGSIAEEIDATLAFCREHFGPGS